MPRIRSLIALALGLVLLGTTPLANQCLSRADIVAQVTAGQLTWKTSQPSGWSTDHTMVTWSDFTTNVANGGTCVQPGGSTSGLMSWSQMIASGCASNHTVSQQSQNFSGNYSTVYYTARYNALTGLYTCFGPYGSDAYSGTPVTLPAGTVSPTSTGTQLSLQLTGITWSGSSSVSVSLFDPGGTQRAGPYITSSPSTSSTTYTYSATGAAAGAWYWQIAQSGGSEGTCDASSGASGGRTQVQWSGTATFYE